MELRSFNQDQVFHPYTAHRQMYAVHSNRQEESMQSTPNQQSPKSDSRHIVSDGKQDCGMRSDTHWNMIMMSGKSPAKIEIRTGSGWISHRLERLGIDT